MTLQTLLFYMLATIAVGSAVLMVTLQNIARSLFLFFVVLFAVAGLYVFALADFIAITQIMVYVGGVLILLLFAFMLSNKALLNELQAGTHHFVSLPAWQGVFISGTFLAIMVYVITLLKQHEPGWITRAQEQATAISPADNTIEQLGLHLMTYFVLPFEVVSVMIMMALIGAAHMARKEPNR
jgi:NAD(P)H-quinone oxidoreductase subunit 6